MGIPTAIPMMRAVLLESDSVATPFVTTLDEPTVNDPTVPEDPIDEARAEDEVVVVVLVPAGVVPVPLTTTEPNLMLVKVIKSTKVVLTPIPVSNHDTN